LHGEHRTSIIDETHRGVNVNTLRFNYNSELVGKVEKFERSAVEQNKKVLVFFIAKWYP